MIGGCCGTTPDFMKVLIDRTKHYNPRKLQPEPDKPLLMLSGMSEFIMRHNLNFVNVGERCNVSGSAAFKKLIMNHDYEKALSVAMAQVDAGAQILDFNFDHGLIDGISAMTKFVRLCSSNPSIACVPFMIDSSKFEIVEAGLQNFQGRSVVNSISLKVGEEEFLKQAQLVKSYGAAVVIMAFD